MYGFFLCLDSAGIDQFLLKFLRMFQVVVLMLLLGSVEAFEGLNADVYRLGGFFCQSLWERPSKMSMMEIG